MLTTKEEIKQWLDNYNIKNYIINDDLIVNVDGEVRLYNKFVTEIPFQFGTVEGDLMLSRNKLTSLKGCPSIVNGNFDCSHNQLLTLEFCPQLVNGNFYFQGNKVSNLDFIPHTVTQTLSCGNNPLLNFNGIFNANIDSFSHWASKEERIIKEYEEYYEILINIQNEIEGWAIFLDNKIISAIKMNNELTKELNQNNKTSKKLKI